MLNWGFWVAKSCLLQVELAAHLGERGDVGGGTRSQTAERGLFASHADFEVAPG